jgi:hypothetical protein
MAEGHYHHHHHEPHHHGHQDHDAFTEANRTHWKYATSGISLNAFICLSSDDSNIP